MARPTQTLYHIMACLLATQEQMVYTEHWDPKSKLNNEKVLKIVDMYKAGEYSQYQIAKMFNVSRSAILRGESWSEITGIKNPINVFSNNMNEHKRKLTEKYPPNYAWGENASRNKLNVSQVLEIRSRGKMNYKNQNELAKKYGVTRSAIQAIMEGRNWKKL